MSLLRPVCDFNNSHLVGNRSYRWLADHECAHPAIDVRLLMRHVTVFTLYPVQSFHWPVQGTVQEMLSSQWKTIHSSGRASEVYAPIMIAPVPPVRI